MLDVACGQGRHMAWFAALGFQVTGIDQSAESLKTAAAFGITVLADIENATWPLMTSLGPHQFDVVVVTNYLWRPLLPVIVQSLAPGGLLLYETFAVGNETVGRPARPDFLLQPAELLQVSQDLHVVAYENGFSSQPERFVQRIAAIQPARMQVPATAPARYPLSLK